MQIADEKDLARRHIDQRGGFLGLRMIGDEGFVLLAIACTSSKLTKRLPC